MSDTPAPGLDWYELIRTAAALTTPVIALLALRNWQRQDKAKREAEFPDALVDASHAYISEMSKPIVLTKYVKIAMNGHTPTWEGGTDDEKKAKGAIAYIKSMGRDDATRLLEALDGVRPSRIKLQSLAAKGQVFQFEDYYKAFNALKMLMWQFERIEALAVQISQSSLNWEHPDVLRVLQKVIEIDASEVEASVGEHNVALLKFVRETYATIYVGRPLWKRRANG